MKIFVSAEENHDWARLSLHASYEIEALTEPTSYAAVQVRIDGGGIFATLSSNKKIRIKLLYCITDFHQIIFIHLK